MDCGPLGVKQTLCQERKIRDFSQSWNTSVELTLQLHLIEKNNKLLGLIENLRCDWNNTTMNNFKQNETYILTHSSPAFFLSELFSLQSKYCKHWILNPKNLFKI